MSENTSTVKAATPSPLFPRASTTEFSTDIIKYALQSDAWDSFATNNPAILKADKDFDIELKKLPACTRFDVEAVHGDVLIAYMDAAFLFGMHFMESIRATAISPLTLFQSHTDSAEA